MGFDPYYSTEAPWLCAALPRSGVEQATINKYMFEDNSFTR